MAKPNYAFAKRQRDLAKKQKKEEKRQRKTEENPEGAETSELDSSGDTEGEPTSDASENQPDN
ncbi:MAG: hypothetical protein O3C28_14535 [Proteobacteria bacterium]|nr:hypothetical protein [Pseudomonadota bacterium]